MSDNEYTIDITSNVDTTPIQELSSQLDQVTNQANQVNDALNINSESLDSVSSSADSVSNGLDTASASANNLETELDIDDTSLLNVSSSSDTATSSLDNTSQSASKLDNNINSIDSTGMNYLQGTANNLSDSLNNTTNSTSLLSGAVAGITALGLSSFLNEAATSADTVSQEFARVGINLNLSNSEMNKTKDLMSQVRAETSRTGSEVRTHFSDMGLAGVKNTELIGKSFQMISGVAFMTGQSIDSVSNSFKKMIQTNKIGARQLTILGLSTNEVSAAMKKLGYDVGEDASAVSSAFEKMGDDVQANVLTTAMELKGAGKAAEEYSSTYEASLANLKVSIGGITRQIGEGVISVIQPIIDTVSPFITRLVNGFNKLPDPIRNFIKTIIGVGAIIAVIITGIAAFITILSILNIVKTITTITTMALAIAEFLLASPILLIIGLILILIGIFIYLYYNNETVRNSINALGEAITAFAAWIQGAFINTMNFFKTLPGRIWNILSNIINKIRQWGSSIINTGRNSVNNFVNSIINTAKSLPGKFYNAISGITGKVKEVFTKAWNTAKGFIDKMSKPFDKKSYSGWYGEVERGTSSAYGTPETFQLFKKNNKQENNTMINIEVNGIVEEKASEYIINTITQELKKKNLINGN